MHNNAIAIDWLLDNKELLHEYIRVWQKVVLKLSKINYKNVDKTCLQSRILGTLYVLESIHGITFSFGPTQTAAAKGNAQTPETKSNLPVDQFCYASARQKWVGGG